MIKDALLGEPIEHCDWCDASRSSGHELPRRADGRQLPDRPEENLFSSVKPLVPNSSNRRSDLSVAVPDLVLLGCLDETIQPVLAANVDDASIIANLRVRFLK